eukprot:3022298-Ditylum_brightwellii.AAC.1
MPLDLDTYQFAMVHVMCLFWDMIYKSLIMVGTNCLEANWIFHFYLLAAEILAIMLKVHAGGGNTEGSDNSRDRADSDNDSNNNISSFDLGANSYKDDDSSNPTFFVQE